MTKIEALQIALDAMCNFHGGDLNNEEMQAVDVIVNMLAELQLQSRKAKKNRERTRNRYD